MKKYFTILLVLGMSFSAFSQTGENPWAGGLGFHWASFADVNQPLKDQFKNISFQGGVAEAFVSHYLNRYANLELTGGYLNLKLQEHPEYSITSKSFWFVDLNAQIKFLAGEIKEDARLTPYFYFGFGKQEVNRLSLIHI